MHVVNVVCLQVFNVQLSGYGAAIVYNNDSDDLIDMHGGKCTLI